MRFVELREEILRIESHHPPTDAREPLHVHPRQESGADVLSGSLIFEISGEERQVGSGDDIHIPANTPHRFWNATDAEAVSVQCFRPALDIASFFETLFTLGQRGELTAKVAPASFRPRSWCRSSATRFGSTSPPWPVVQALCLVLRPIALRRGYTARLAAPSA